MQTAESYSEMINSRKYKQMYICDVEACKIFNKNCFKKGGGCVHTDKIKHSLKEQLGSKFPPTRFVKIHGGLLIEEVDLAEFVTYYV